MHGSDITARQLVKVKKRPLHVHCRFLLDKAGVTVDEGTLGAPELMLWTLENKADEVDTHTGYTLREVVDMIKDKPSLVLNLLETQFKNQEHDQSLQDVLLEDQPRKAGILLLKLLKKRMDSMID